MNTPINSKSFLKTFGKSVLAAILVLGGLEKAKAQVNISNLNPIVQDFSTLPQTGTFINNSTIPGWYISGATTNTIAASTGTNETAGVKSYGSTTTPADRSLGIVRAANGGTTTLYYGYLLRNNTNGVIRSFQVSYAAELWREPKSNKLTQTMDFDFQKGVTSLTGGTWSAATGTSSASFTTSNGSGPHYRDGNLAAYRQVLTFTINLVLQPGEQVMLRWTNLNSSSSEEHFIALDDITITPVSTPQTFYSKPSGNIDNLANWGTLTNGTGTAPLSFTDHNQTFIINNNTSAAISNSLTIAGLNSKLTVGNGTAAAKLTIPAGRAISGEINVANNATLQVDGSVPVLGTLGTTSTVIFNGADVQDIPQRTYGNLTISGAGTKVLIGNTTVNGVLNFTGGVLTTSDPANTTLTLGAAATLNETSTNYFKGKLVKSTVISGAGSHDFGGMGLTFNNSGNGNWGAVTVTRTTDVAVINPQDDTKESIKRFWNIQPTTQAGTNVNLTFNWLTSEDNGQNYGTNSQAQPWKSTDGGQTWIPVGNLITIATNGDIRTANITTNSFSIWTLSGTNNPLPVSWLSFNGKAINNGNLLTWATASEKNSENFIVERSENGKTFEAIGTVKAAGNSSQILNYQFTDKQPLSGPVSYYRLKQTDFDGAFEYSALVAVAQNNRVAQTIKVYPNPFEHTFTLESSVGQNLKEVVLQTSEGREIYRQKINNDSEAVISNFPELKPGLYLLQIISESGVSTLKVMRK